MLYLVYYMVSMVNRQYCWNNEITIVIAFKAPRLDTDVDWAVWQTEWRNCAISKLLKPILNCILNPSLNCTKNIWKKTTLHEKVQSVEIHVDLIFIDVIETFPNIKHGFGFFVLCLRDRFRTLLWNSKIYK